MSAANPRDEADALRRTLASLLRQRASGTVRSRVVHQAERYAIALALLEEVRDRIDWTIRALRDVKKMTPAAARAVRATRKMTEAENELRRALNPDATQSPKKRRPSPPRSETKND